MCCRCNSRRRWTASTRKCAIRCARRRNRSYLQDGGSKLLDDFYAVFARNMRDLGTPVYSRNFFAQILKAFPERARVHVVSQGSTPAARAHVSDRFDRRNSVGIVDTRLQCAVRQPAPVERSGAAGRGCATFDFGRSTPDEAPTGSRRSGVPSRCRCAGSSLPGRRAPNTGPTNPKFELAVSMWKKLPAGGHWFGPMIVRAIP